MREAAIARLFCYQYVNDETQNGHAKYTAAAGDLICSLLARAKAYAGFCVLVKHAAHAGGHGLACEGHGESRIERYIAFAQLKIGRLS